MLKLIYTTRKKWLKKNLITQRHLHSQIIFQRSKCTDIYTSKFDNLIFLGDFNAGVEDTDIKNFCSSYNLTSMVNKAMCHKNPDKPTCIDLILIKSPGSFQNSCVVETGLSDFHKMFVTVMKTFYRKSQPKIIHCRNYENFSNDNFRDSLQKIFPQNLGNTCDQDVNDFLISCNKIVDQHAPRKKKYVRGNHSPFMNKNLSKAVMLRTKLRNIFLKNRTEENKNRSTKKVNLCETLLRKSKRAYFNNLNEKNVCDNKKFWRVVKPLLSNKIILNEKITTVEGDKIVNSDKGPAKVLNEFFANVVTNVNIPQFNQID